MMTEQDRTLLECYDFIPPVRFFMLPGLGSNNRIIGVHTGAGEYVWKTYKAHSHSADSLYEHALLVWLAAFNLSFAVPVPIETRGGGTICSTPEGLKGLFTRLPGTALNPGNLHQVQSMGAALGELHCVLAHYTTELQPGIPAFGDLDRLHPKVPDPNLLSPARIGLPEGESNEPLFAVWRENLEAIRPFLNGSYQSLPRQAVHRDFDPSNTLVDDEDRVAGILDFEFAGLDARALDIAVSLKFTMRVWENQRPWEVARAFCRGYQRVNRLTQLEVEAIPHLIRLRDVASTVLRIGRAIASGDVRHIPGRIEAVNHSFNWLKQNEDRLISLIGKEII